MLISLDLIRDLAGLCGFTEGCLLTTLCGLQLASSAPGAEGLKAALEGQRAKKLAFSSSARTQCERSKVRCISKAGFPVAIS